MTVIVPREYGVATTVDFSLLEIDGVDFRVDAVHASADTVINKDEAGEANTGSGFVDRGRGYSQAFTATEMEAARIHYFCVDQGTKVWLDKDFIIETYGHTSSQYGLSADVLIATDMATRTSQTSFTGTDGSADDDAYKGHIVVITDQATNTQKSAVLVLSYIGSTKTFTTTTPTFTTAAGDLIDVLAASPSLPAALPGAADGLPTSDPSNQIAGIVGTFNTFDGIVDANGRVDIGSIAGEPDAANDLGRWLDGFVRGTADSGTTTTLVDAALTQGDDAFFGYALVLTSGTNDLRAVLVTGFDAASDTVTFTPALPDAITVENYVLAPLGSYVSVEAWLRTAAAATTAGVPDVNTARINDALVVGDGNATPWDGA